MSTGSPDESDRNQCTPCRGTGTVVSALGGDSHQVTCPWCEGSGRFSPGHDAQEHVSEPASKQA